MADEIGDLMRGRTRQLEEEHPFVWLFTVQVPTDPITVYRLTNYDAPLRHGFATNGAELEFSPMPIVHGPIREDGRGELPRMQLQLSNANLALRSVLETYDGLDGQSVTIKLVSLLEITDPAAGIQIDGQVASASSAADRVTWDIAAATLLQAMIPSERYMRKHCRFRPDYGGPRCGYDLTNATLAAAFPRCAGTLQDCRAHGDAEVAAGLLRQHPGRFGGKPGIPRIKRR